MKRVSRVGAIKRRIATFVGSRRSKLAETVAETGIKSE